MKKLLAMLLPFAMLMSLCACGGGAASSTPVAGTEAADSEEPAAEVTEDPSAEAVDWQSVYDEAASLYYTDYDYPAAFEKLQGAEESDNASVLYLLGLCCYNGNGTERDEAKGAELLAKAVELGSISAKYYLADAYKTGRGVEADSEKADELYKSFLTEAESAEPADTPEYAQLLYYITNCYAHGYGTKFDSECAAKYAKMTLESGNAGVLYTYAIGVMYEQKRMGAENADKAQTIFAESFLQIEELANKGIDKAQQYCAQYYQYGDGGVEQDYTKALEWYEKAAEHGNYAAMIGIGNMYVNGDVEQDYTKAMEWYEQAAELGSDTAMSNIGHMYINGNGVEQDYAKAREWYEKAAEHGNTSAMVNLGTMYSRGDGGVEKDDAKALEWYEKAAELGNAYAMYNLGVMYANGNGVEQDYAKAMEWYEQAVSLGNELAAENIANLRNQGLVS